MATGCQNIERIGECRAIAASVNPELEQLARTFAARGSIAQTEYQAASAGYLRAANRLRHLHLKDTELSKLAHDMGEELLAVSRSCDRFAVEAGRGRNEQSAQREFESLGTRHRAAVNAIDRRCAE